MVVTGMGKNNLRMSKIGGRRITRCMQFATLTQIAPLRFATSHTPRTLYAMCQGRESQ
jgi:hypothetical protein